jgi:hypothetical protein
VKDVNVVLREKELDIVRVRNEIEALRSAIPCSSTTDPWMTMKRRNCSRPSFPRNP